MDNLVKKNSGSGQKSILMTPEKQMSDAVNSGQNQIPAVVTSGQKDLPAVITSGQNQTPSVLTGWTKLNT